jgi:hypothetical protein
MAMTPSQLLDEIDAAGGQLEVLPDRGLRCRNIPPILKGELVRLQHVVVAILLGECEPRPLEKLDTRNLRKLIQAIEDAGGQFRPNGQLFECEYPILLEYLHNKIIDNAAALTRLLWPPAKSSKPKVGCMVCKTGQGCRRRHHIRMHQTCPTCGHPCYKHFLGVHDFQGEELFRPGCNQSLQTGPVPGAGILPFFLLPPVPRCSCPGWPIALAPARSTRKSPLLSTEKSMSLFSSEHCEPLGQLSADPEG